MFDEIKAQRAVDFFRRYLSHTTGKWDGKPFTLLPWQEDLLRKMYGTVDASGRRQYRTVFVFVPKKNGKSELASGVALYGLMADGEKGAEVYSAAGDREQAAIVYNTAVKMIRANRQLRTRCRIRESTKRVSVPKTNSFWRVLSSESKTKHGLNVSTAIIDELHVVSNELYEVLTQGAGDAREQPLTFMISTAGDDKSSPCYEEYKRAKRVISGEIIDPTYLAVIYEAPDGSAWDDEKTWIAANPSIGHTIDIASLRQACLKAKEIPRLEAAFKQLRLNIWSSGPSKWLRRDRWDALSASIKLDDFKKQSCYGALDLSTTTDLSAFALVFHQQIDGRSIFYPFLKLYCPAEGIKFRSRKDHVPYQEWMRKGYLTATPGDVIDYAYIKADVKQAMDQFDVRQINVDRWNSSQLVVDLQTEGAPIATFGQGFASMSAPTKELEKLILAGQISHDGNPAMSWMIDNVTVKTDEAGNFKPDKKKSIERIDGVVAMIMALDGWLRNPNVKSIYESQGVKTV